jgi:hypothetical protein
VEELTVQTMLLMGVAMVFGPVLARWRAIHLPLIRPAATFSPTQILSLFMRRFAG